MVLLQGIQLPDNKPLRYALLQFYGISHDRSHRILAALSIHETCLVGALSEEQVNRLGQHLTTLTLETDLRRQMRGDIARLRNIGSYRGRRHAMGLPVRGQNTQNNGMTARKLNRVERRNFGTTTTVTTTVAARASGIPNGIAQLGRLFGRAKFML